MSRRPTTSELLRAVIQSFLEEVHVCLPAKVLSYDKDEQTAKVQITVRRAQKTRRKILHEDYPIIENVPICWPEGGGYSLQFPMAQGDHVALLFSEWAYSQWRETGEVSNPGDLTRHDLSYPFGIPSIRPKGKKLPNPGNGALVTTPAGGALSVSEDGGAPEPVAIASKVEAELTALKTTLGSGTADGDPVIWATPYTGPADLGSSNLKAE